jgi:trans-2,3-dihydro-3-hydroxyanthranilate isomerase
MDTRQALLVDAFTEEPMTGNPAGVVPDADGLDDDQLGAIANELGASETAFLTDSETADRRVRYFTPANEVDLCGHATVASHAYLFERGHIDAGEHTLETNVGELTITVDDTGLVWMTQDQPDIRRVDVDYDEVAAALGLDIAALEDVGADLPLARATTGLPFLMVPVNFIDHLRALEPDMRAIEDISDEVETAGIYAFTFDTLDGDATLHARMFAPGEGVPEDPVTGTASGACGAYLREYQAFDSMPEEMVFEQGHFVDRPGRVHVKVGAEIEVGGRAVTTLDGDLVVPESEDDEIIEV